MRPGSGEATDGLRADEGAGGDDTGEDGVIPGVHGILDGIAEDEEENQIE